MIDINDPIHKTITLSDREKEVADHPYVQRLRLIRQLGFVPLVYPSATHDRFSHALGTMHVSGLLARQLFRNEEYSALAKILNEEEKQFLTQIIRLAGLLHDVGHAPLSHPAEPIMPRLKELDLPWEWYKDPREERRATHEDYSVMLIAGMSRGEKAVISPDEAEIISSLIHHKKIKIPSAWHARFSQKINPESLHALVRSMISGDIDADRMDYLLRDSHFTGVVYGHFDLSWLIANLGVVENEGNYFMSVSDGGIHALEHYLFARYHMYVQVYMHKTVKCFEYYFQKALEEREADYTIPVEEEEYVNLNDATLLESIFRAARKRGNIWSYHLAYRKPAKRIARIWGEKKESERIFKKLIKELKPLGVKPFLKYSQVKFLEDDGRRNGAPPGKQGAFLFGLAAVPLAVVRHQFGVKSMASLADYSFILKYYHRDVSMGDIYILPVEYKKNQETILLTIKNHRLLSPSEVLLNEESPS